MPPVSGAYLELCLGKQTPIPVSPLKSRSTSGSLLEIFKLIEKARNDRHIRGLVLNLSGFSADRSSLWELRKMLESFKTPDSQSVTRQSGPGTERRKKIVAYLSRGDMDLYCLVSVADKIVLDPTGSLSFLGFLYGRGFVHRTLEKAGIGVRELRYLKYKSVQELFTRNSLSEADKEQYGAYLDDTIAVTRALLMESRSWSADDIDRIMNDEYLYSAGRAKERGLVDYTGQGEAVQEAVQELEGGEPKFWFRWGDAQFSLLPAGYGEKGTEAGKGTGTSTGAGKGAGKENKKRTGAESGKGLEPRPYRTARGGFPGEKGEIALIYARGQTDFERGMAARNLAPLIRKISCRKAVKALVLRVESPGGSADAADHIARALSDAKKRIPVVVSMGSVAASGGYWVSMNANSIVASPYTLTGSIGVIAAWFFDKGFYDKLGLGVDMISRGAHADLMAGFLIPCRDLSGEEEEQFRRLILDLYAGFVANVAAGRNLSPEAVEAVAQGRVYSGLGAKEAGLVDQIGGLAEALQTARKLAGIPADKRVRYSEYPKPRFIDKLSARFGLSMPSFAASGALPLPAFLRALWPAGIPDDLWYRLSRNGEAMPILPLGSLP